jgi:protein-S-isoprenylcysteine O-methyltransferase Ste14
MGVMEEQRLTALRRQVVKRFVLVLLIMPIILYLISETLQYWQGWLYFAVLFMPMLLIMNYFLKVDPELLERRMKFREQEREQIAIVFLGIIILAAGFLAIGYDLHQHGLNQVPSLVVLAANVGVFLGYSLVFWVLKENSYASRTIEVESGQKVVTTGPYSIIRHPMYLGTIVMYLLTPIALGSWWAVPVFLLFIPLFIWRITGEEKVLLKDLPGYREYCQKRRYRLLPHVW